MECAHSDTVWACGIRLNEDERFDADKWRGQNILGFALMEVRDILRKKEPVLSLILDAGFDYVDNRSKGGPLWIIVGEEEGKELVDKCGEYGI